MKTLQQKISDWYPKAVQNPLHRLTFENSKLHLQLKVNRRNDAIVIVLVELAEELRGQGLFTRFLDLQKVGTVEVDCPQERLAAYCERNGITYAEC